MHDYRYPTNEAHTDRTEIEADPYKLSRERHMIASHLSFAWRVCLDFGSGTGRHLSTLALTQPPGKLGAIIAYDADTARLNTAQAAYAGHADVVFHAGARADLSTAVSDASLDAILCCQVLGHTTYAETDAILGFFRRKLAPGGYAILCVPFRASAHHDDFCHAVDMRAPGDAYGPRRVPLTAAAFDRMAATPEAGLLPVRAFQIAPAPPGACNADLPISIAPPPALVVDWAVTACQIYSIHTVLPDGAMIGDLILKLRRI